MLSLQFMKTETHIIDFKVCFNAFRIRVEPAAFLASKDHVVITLFKRVIVLYFFKQLKGY